MPAKFYYDKDYDNLIISEKEDNEKVKKNFVFDDIAISLTRSGKVVGIEIMNVSDYLKDMGLNPKILREVNGAKIIVKSKKDFIYIGFELMKRTLIKRITPAQRVNIATIPMTCIR